jgi:putative membrane protein
MTVLAWIATLVTATVHILVFVGESLLFQHPRVHQGVFSVPTAEVQPVRLWAFNVGFYNLFLACGMIAGVITWAAGNEAVGRALVLYTCLFVFLAGIVLFVSDRMALSRPRGTGVGGAIGQSLPPLVALIALALS